MGRISGKRILMIIAPAKFRDEELFETRRVIEKQGGRVTLASSNGKPSTGMLGGEAVPDVKLSDVDPEDFDAVVFVGGGGSEVYFDDPTAHKVAKIAKGSGKAVCAICIAPSILANAGILEGKNATVWKGDKYVGLVKKGGAKYTGEPVTVDGQVITANGPTSAKKFGVAIVKALM